MSGDEEVKAENMEISPQAEGEDDFRPFDEVAESYQPSKMLHVPGDDGLPILTAPEATGESDIPPLSPETLVCMADLSEFHLYHGTDLLQSFSREEVISDGPIWLVPQEALTSRTKDQLELEKRPAYSGPVVVQPKRAACEYYVRQITQFEHNPEARVVLRLCSARRTTEGAFMSVRDTAVWACTMRNPRDYESEELIDNFDKEKVSAGSRRVHLSIFDG